MVGKTDFDFYPEALANRYYDDEQTIIRTGQPLINHEEPFVHPDGVGVWNLTTKVPLKDIHGKIIGLVGVSRDISKRKKVEEELNNYRDHLEELVLDRTADLTKVNKQLIEEVYQRTRAEEALRKSSPPQPRWFYAFRKRGEARISDDPFSTRGPHSLMLSLIHSALDRA